MRSRQIVSATCAVLFVAAFAWRAASVSPDFGDPIAGLTPAQQALFADGKEDFEEVEEAADGLGPVFNGTSCAECHSSPAVGGTSATFETRFGRILNGRFDPMTEFGGSLIQTTGIGPQGSCDFAGEKVPPEATIVAGRLTTPLFGLGLVDAVPMTWEISAMGSSKGRRRGRDAHGTALGGEDAREAASRRPGDDPRSGHPRA